MVACESSRTPRPLAFVAGSMSRSPMVSGRGGILVADCFELMMRNSVLSSFIFERWLWKDVWLCVSVHTTVYEFEEINTINA